jgi:hypothetical protein
MHGKRKKQSVSLEWAHECMVKLSECVKKQTKTHGMHEGDNFSKLMRLPYLWRHAP